MSRDLADDQVSAAYLALAAGHSRDLGALGHVPVLDLTLTIVGVPAAALGGWILAGRKLSSAARLTRLAARGWSYQP
jgi:hypothetical protein